MQSVIIEGYLAADPSILTAQGSGKADLWSVDLTGVNEHAIPTPLDGSDPAWGPLLP